MQFQNNGYVTINNSGITRKFFYIINSQPHSASPSVRNIRATTFHLSLTSSFSSYSWLARTDLPKVKFSICGRWKSSRWEESVEKSCTHRKL